MPNKEERQVRIIVDLVAKDRNGKNQRRNDTWLDVEGSMDEIIKKKKRDLNKKAMGGKLIEIKSSIDIY